MSQLLSPIVFTIGCNHQVWWFHQPPVRVDETHYLQVTIQTSTGGMMDTYITTENSGQEGRCLPRFPVSWCQYNCFWVPGAHIYCKSCKSRKSICLHAGPFPDTLFFFGRGPAVFVVTRFWGEPTIRQVLAGSWY